jgi:hypothetical protein
LVAWLETVTQANIKIKYISELNFPEVRAHLKPILQQLLASEELQRVFAYST